eukprot:GHVN01050538.1.p1 GENE.GHVN01050538.1~~GHVN01050538.1.p1  ORF type:complete len:1103 (+),score=237.64 GHVN01050538.1:166-3474(+)
MRYHSPKLNFVGFVGLVYLVIPLPTQSRLQLVIRGHDEFGDARMYQEGRSEYQVDRPPPLGVRGRRWWSDQAARGVVRRGGLPLMTQDEVIGRRSENEAGKVPWWRDQDVRAELNEPDNRINRVDLSGVDRGLDEHGAIIDDLSQLNYDPADQVNSVSSDMGDRSGSSVVPIDTQLGQVELPVPTDSGAKGPLSSPHLGSSIAASSQPDSSQSLGSSLRSWVSALNLGALLGVDSPTDAFNNGGVVDAGQAYRYMNLMPSAFESQGSVSDGIQVDSSVFNSVPSESVNDRLAREAVEKGIACTRVRYPSGANKGDEHPNISSSPHIGLRSHPSPINNRDGLMSDVNLSWGGDTDDIAGGDGLFRSFSGIGRLSPKIAPGSSSAGIGRQRGPGGGLHPPHSSDGRHQQPQLIGGERWTGPMSVNIGLPPGSSDMLLVSSQYGPEVMKLRRSYLALVPVPVSTDRGDAHGSLTAHLRCSGDPRNAGGALSDSTGRQLPFIQQPPGSPHLPDDGVEGGESQQFVFDFRSGPSVSPRGALGYGSYQLCLIPGDMIDPLSVELGIDNQEEKGLVAGVPAPVGMVTMRRDDFNALSPSTQKEMGEVVYGDDSSPEMGPTSLSVSMAVQPLPAHPPIQGEMRNSDVVVVDVPVSAPFGAMSHPMETGTDKIRGGVFSLSSWKSRLFGDGGNEEYKVDVKVNSIEGCAAEHSAASYPAQSVLTSVTLPGASAMEPHSPAQGRFTASFKPPVDDTDFAYPSPQSYIACLAGGLLKQPTLMGLILKASSGLIAPVAVEPRAEAQSDISVKKMREMEEGYGGEMRFESPIEMGVGQVHENAGLGSVGDQPIGLTGDQGQVSEVSSRDVGKGYSVEPQVRFTLAMIASATAIVAGLVAKRRDAVTENEESDPFNRSRTGDTYRLWASSNEHTDVGLNISPPNSASTRDSYGHRGASERVRLTKEVLRGLERGSVASGVRRMCEDTIDNYAVDSRGVKQTRRGDMRRTTPYREEEAAGAPSRRPLLGFLYGTGSEGESVIDESEDGDHFDIFDVDSVSSGHINFMESMGPDGALAGEGIRNERPATVQWSRYSSLPQHSHERRVSIEVDDGDPRW